MKKRDISVGGAYRATVFGMRPDPKLSQWMTPQWLCDRMVVWAAIHDEHHVLEPSAGDGAIVKALLDEGMRRKVIAIECDKRLIPGLSNLSERVRRENQLEVICGDFLAAPCPPADVAVMNPPYEKRQDEKFILHALTGCRRVIALARLNLFCGKGRFKEFWDLVACMRAAFLVSRPDFGGGHTSMQDFCVLELTHRKRMPLRDNISIEWWEQ